LESSKRITLEYVLLKGVTNSLEDSYRLAVSALKFPCKINLILFNPHEAGAGTEAHRRAKRDDPKSAAQEEPREGSGFEEPIEEDFHELCRGLASKDLTVSVRRSKGQDVDGACGQLVREGGSRPNLGPSAAGMAGWRQFE